MAWRNGHWAVWRVHPQQAGRVELPLPLTKKGSEPLIGGLRRVGGLLPRAPDRAAKCKLLVERQGAEFVDRDRDITVVAEGHPPRRSAARLVFDDQNGRGHGYVVVLAHFQPDQMRMFAKDDR